MTRSRPLRWAGVMLALLALLVGVTLAVPSLRATAAELLGFTRADSDRIEPTLPFVEAPPALSSIQELEQVAGFDVLEPIWLPPGFAFKDAHYFGQVASTQYRRIDEESPMPAGFGIDQAIVTGPPLFPNIGASAKVESVRIGEVQGEYVKGGWVSHDTLEQGGRPGTVEQLKMQWDPTQPSQQLQWQVGEFTLTIHTGPDLTKDDLVAIAQSLR